MNGLAGFTEAQAASETNATGRTYGSARETCPLGTLTVTVNCEGSHRPRGRIQVNVSGPQSRSSHVRAGGTATFRRMPAGTYNVTARLRNWRQRPPDPGTVTVPAGGSGNIAINLFACHLVRVLPEGSPDPQEVYVNVGHNREIDIEAHLSTREQGITVYFTLDSHRNNRSSATLLAPLRASLSPESSQTDENGIARTTLTLSRYGGDRFRVSASLEQNQRPGSRNAKESKWFKVWRHVYCEVDCMRRPNGGTYADRAQTAAMKREYRRHFVRIDDTGSDSRPMHKRTVTENDAAAYCRALRNGTDTPSLHFVYMDSIIWDPSNQSHWITLRRTHGHKDFEARNTTVHLTDTANPNRWLHGNVQIEITRRLANGTNSVTNNNLPDPASHLTMRAVGDKFRLSWDLRNLMGLGNRDRFPSGITRVRMHITLEVWEEGSGLAAGGSSIIGMRFRERRYRGSGLTNRIRKTIIHESGHNMGLASRYAPDGTQPATYYYNAGPHCHNNHDRCVMYGILHSHYTFCETCGQALRARDLSSLPVSGTSPM